MADIKEELKKTIEKNKDELRKIIEEFQIEAEKLKKEKEVLMGTSVKDHGII